MAQKAVAFTLAETLLVMGIIGVVSALTLPNLNSSTSDKEKVAKVKKFYQNITEAMGRAEAAYGPFGTWCPGNSCTNANRVKRIGDRLTEFMKVQKNCGNSGSVACYNTTASGTDQLYEFITADGMSVRIIWDELIYLDIDGPQKGPNTNGKDRFVFACSYNNGDITPMGQSLVLSATQIGEFFNTSCNKNGGMYCTGWVIVNGNMDYLKVGTDGKCPNGTQLSTTVTSCK